MCVVAISPAEQPVGECLLAVGVFMVFQQTPPLPMQPLCPPSPFPCAELNIPTCLGEQQRCVLQGQLCQTMVSQVLQPDRASDNDGVEDDAAQGSTFQGSLAAAPAPTTTNVHV